MKNEVVYLRVKDVFDALYKGYELRIYGYTYIIKNNILYKSKLGRNPKQQFFKCEFDELLAMVKIRLAALPITLIKPPIKSNRQFNGQ